MLVIITYKRFISAIHCSTQVNVIFFVFFFLATALCTSFTARQFMAEQLPRPPLMVIVRLGCHSRVYGE